MTSIVSKAALLGGALSIAIAGLAFAAPAATPGEPARVEKPARGGPGGPGRGMRHRPDPERHAQHLRDILQLTAAQERALKTFIDATKPTLRERPAPGAARPAPPERKSLTTPERLDRQAEMMARRQAEFTRRSAATKAFYAQLTAPQKKAFDALGLDAPGGKGGPGMRMMRRAGGDMPPMAFAPEDADMMLGAVEMFDEDLDMDDSPGA